MEARRLCHEVDENDNPYLALTLHLDGRLWTDDAELKAGLRAKVLIVSSSSPSGCKIAPARRDPRKPLPLSKSRLPFPKLASFLCRKAPWAGGPTVGHSNRAPTFILAGGGSDLIT